MSMDDFNDLYSDCSWSYCHKGHSCRCRSRRCAVQVIRSITEADWIKPEEVKFLNRTTMRKQEKYDLLMARSVA